MRHGRWLLALSALVLVVADLPGQVIISTQGPAFGGYGAFGGSFQYGPRLGHGRLAFGFGGYGYYGWPSYWGSFRQTTIIYSPPIAYYPVPVPVPVPAAPVDQLAMDILPPEAWPLAQLRRQPLDQFPPPAQRPPQRPPPEPKPAAPPPQANPPRPPPQPVPPPQPQPPPPPKPLPPPPQPPPPAREPLDENARQMDQGKQAFAARTYGKAAELFRLAIRAAPNLPQAHFLLAQAYFALGKYPEAVDAIQAGMALQPDWPAARFRPRELYGLNAADYLEQLRRLEQIIQANPADPLLLFLYAYQLWFDGRQDEARVWFQKALPGSPYRDLIQRFLRTPPAAPAM